MLDCHDLESLYDEMSDRARPPSSPSLMLQAWGWAQYGVGMGGPGERVLEEEKLCTNSEPNYRWELRVGAIFLLCT